MRWPAPTIDALDGAAAAARAGTPVVLAIEGRAGFGKSTLLRAAVARLDGFHTLRAYGEQSAQDERFQVLQEWHGQSTPRHTLQATRLLGQVVDQRQLTGPVALVVDDLQWIDPESVDTLTRLVERAAGDRLLVLAAHRPLGRRHPAWRRLGAPTVRLDGLDTEAAAALVASVDPDAPAGLAEQLRVHTGGSPLHMRALLQEHSAQELASLAARGELPAPADLAAAVDARIAELAPDAARLLHALAVLGDAWTDLPTAAAVGGVIDRNSAVAVLADEDLLRLDRTSAVPRVRISHAVLRAAAYDTIPTATRRGLHRAAAARLAGTGDRLRHRVAAALGPDEGLATDLDRHGDDLHDRARYREAARFRRLAAATTAAPADSERRLLDADVESFLARELDDISVTELDKHASAQRQFVYAIRLSATRQWVRAARVFDDVDPDALDPMNAYRARVMRAWTILGSGRPPGDALPWLQAAAAAPTQDSAFRAGFVTIYGQVMVATARPTDPVWGVEEIRDVDRAALATSPEGLQRLSWRGAAAAVTGATDRAIGDLSVVTERMGDGAFELGDGVPHALLGLAQWCAGEWQRASINIGLARAVARSVPPQPVVLAVAPLAAIVSGEDPRQALAHSRAARLAGPLPTAIHVGDVVEVAALAFAGSPQERRQWRARRTADFGAPTVPTMGQTPFLWLAAMGLGAAWAGDAEATDAWADALVARQGVAWRTNAVAWLRACAARARGHAASFDAIAQAGLPGLGSFTALLWVDAAQETSTPQVRKQAETALATLDAGRYAPILLPDASAPNDPLTALSDRERDVAALLLEGLSYAQIAKELYVTRSTVNYHLSNVYAKTGTSTRHEFVQLLRRVNA